MNWIKRLTPWSTGIDQDLIPAPANAPKTSTAKEDELRGVIRVQKASIAKLREERDDFKQQNEEYRKSRFLSPDEEAVIRTLRSEHKVMTEQQNKLALWLWDNKQPEIVAGKHNGMELADIIIMYLGQTIPDRTVIQ